LAALDRDGEQARVVGGAIRNTLIGEAAGDIDIATTALPDEVVQRVQAASFKAVPTGIEHGTITVIAQGRPFEITTLRQDVETFGRRARVVFGRDWRRDAERRDFTMNALSVSRDGTIYDYVDGLSDIAARRVRFIGNPQARIAEDYLRILRFFRFHASYGEGAPDPEALAACVAGRAGLEQLSRERIRMELFKLVVGRRAPAALAVMTDCGLLDLVLAGVPTLASFAKMVELEMSLALSPDAVRRLAALAVCVVEDAERLRERLRTSNAEHERLCSMAHGWRDIGRGFDEQRARVLLYRIGGVLFTDRVLLAWARSTDHPGDPSWVALATLPGRWTAPRFPLKAADFMRRGVPCGPKLGAALAAAEEAWMAAGFPLEADALSAIADAAARMI
jgi:poly(A) polymerase